MSLETKYLGLTLPHPIVASSSPLSRDIEGILALEDAGVSAVTLHSLFEEQLIEESRVTHHFQEYGSDSCGESLSYLPELEDYNSGPDGYLELIRTAKERTALPIIGSLNGVTPGGWKEYAQKIEEAGADALELNLYFTPFDAQVPGAEVEQRYRQVVREVRAHTKLPLALKLASYFSSLPHFVSELISDGGNALVLFNRFCQPDINLETLTLTPSVSLSTTEDFRLPLNWVAILYGHVEADLAITSGVHTFEEVIKGVMVGASVTMMTSALLKNDLGTVGTTLENVRNWMEQREYDSIEQMRGALSRKHAADPAAFHRINYMKTLQSWRPDPTLGHWGGMK